jgi:hypothetical protein
MKICRTCANEKPLSEFYKHVTMLDGHLNICRDCTRARVRQHRQLNDHVREYDRERGVRQSNKAVNERWTAKYPTRRAAHTALSNAIRDKRVQKRPCLFCGSEKVEGHHRDYSKPLDVVWLCPTCHRRLHANFPDTAVTGDH